MGLHGLAYHSQLSWTMFTTTLSRLETLSIELQATPESYVQINAWNEDHLYTITHSPYGPRAWFPCDVWADSRPFGVPGTAWRKIVIETDWETQRATIRMTDYNGVTLGDTISGSLCDTPPFVYELMFYVHPSYASPVYVDEIVLSNPS